MAKANTSNTEEIKFDRWDYGMPDSEDQRDLANGYYDYIENGTVGDNIKVLKQVADVTVVTSARGILATTEANGIIYGLGKDAGGKVTIWVYTNGTWTSNTPSDYPEDYTEQNNPLFIFYGGSILFQNGTYVGSCGNANPTTGIISSMGGHLTADLGARMIGGVVLQSYAFGWIPDSANGDAIWSVMITPVKKITIPYPQRIVDILPYGNLLAIICTCPDGDSKMYLWDGANLSTTPYYDIINIGVGNVLGGAIIDGVIHTVIAGFNNKDLRIKKYVGGVFTTEFYYNGRSNSSGDINLYPISRIKHRRNFLYFLVAGTRPNTTDTYSVSLIRYGNKVEGTQKSFCVYKSFGFTPSAGINTNQIGDFIILDDASSKPNYISIFASMSDAQSPAITWKEAMTTTTFTQPLVVETSIYECGDGSINKQIKAASLQYDGLSGAGVTLKYKADNDTSWTTIFTDSTAGSLSHETVAVEGVGNLPTSKKIKLRIEATGNQTLLGGKFKYEKTHNVYGN